MYSGSYNSFAGTDIVASITLPGGKAVVIGELQTISYSVHREKYPVRALGSVNPKGFTYGGRTIAGSLIFTVFDRHVVKELVTEMQQNAGTYSEYAKNDLEFAEMYSRMVTDELPPFDITISFNNEYGQAASMAILGVTIVDEGQVMSIEDMLTENTMSYMAMDIKLMGEVNR
ncbi:MAG: virion structural protein [Candidatus Bathyarchaeota archaeon]|nr:virion structural protein [Candidatus Bathyarchaeota archaeon]